MGSAVHQFAVRSTGLTTRVVGLGFVEDVSRFSARHGGREGWVLSSRFSSALRVLAEDVEAWKMDADHAGCEKGEMLAGLPPSLVKRLLLSSMNGGRAICVLPPYSLPFGMRHHMNVSLRHVISP